MQLLTYIELHQREKVYFDKNGNRDIYKKLKEDPKLREYNFIIRKFISQHIPK